MASAKWFGEDGNLDGRALAIVDDSREEAVVSLGDALVVDDAEVGIKVGFLDGSCSNAQGEDQGGNKSLEEHRYFYSLTFAFHNYD